MIVLVGRGRAITGEGAPRPAGLGLSRNRLAKQAPRGAPADWDGRRGLPGTRCA